jgi:hypothetical protein
MKRSGGSTRWKPVELSARYTTLDLLRGFALFGVLLLWNLLYFFCIPLFEHMRSRNAAPVRARKEGDDDKHDEVEGVKEVDLLRGHGFTQPHDVIVRAAQSATISPRVVGTVMDAMVTD